MKLYKNLTKEELQQDFNNLKNFQAIGEKYNACKETMQKLGKKLGIIFRDTNRTLNITHPDLCKEWDYDKNEKGPEHYTCGSSARIWWICEEDNEHKWIAQIANRTAGNGCPYHCGKKVGETNNLLFLFPKIAAEWHPTKNSDKKPEDFVPGSNLSVWWVCSKNSDHEWRATISSRTRIETECPYCTNRKACEDNCLLTLYPKTAAEWHPTKNGNKKPKDFVPGSNFNVWWLCSKNLSHEWRASIVDRAHAEHECPYCTNNKVCEDNCFLTLYPQIAAEWHPIKNGDNKPEDFLPGSNYKAWWSCKKNPEHEWQTKITGRVRGNNCPVCAKGWGERCCIYAFNTLFNNTFYKIRPVWLKNPKTNRKLELDGYCPVLNIAFEYQGLQHTEIVKAYKNTDEDLMYQIYKDNIKKEICKNLNVALFEIPQFNKTFRPEHLKDFIKQKCIEKNIPLPENYDDIQLDFSDI